MIREHLPLLMLDGYFHTLSVQKGGGLALGLGLYGVVRIQSCWFQSSVLIHFFLSYLLAVLISFGPHLTNISGHFNLIGTIRGLLRSFEVTWCHWRYLWPLRPLRSFEAINGICSIWGHLRPELVGSPCTKEKVNSNSKYRVQKWKKGLIFSTLWLNDSGFTWLLRRGWLE